jgi:hypothetical protein
MKNKTTRLAESIRNQHVAISVAAGLARAQLVPNPVGVYDAPLADIGQLLHLPLAPAYVDKVNRLVMDIVRAAKSGPVVNQAMRLISALHHARVIGEARSGAVDAALASLQQAAEKAKA